VRLNALLVVDDPARTVSDGSVNRRDVPGSSTQKVDHGAGYLGCSVDGWWQGAHHDDALGPDRLPFAAYGSEAAQMPHRRARTAVT
jgi:hypothetical protein